MTNGHIYILKIMKYYIVPTLGEMYRLFRIGLDCYFQIKN